MQKNSKGGGELNDTIGPPNLVNTLMIRTRIFDVGDRFPKLFTAL